jgi:hypothetical protein
MSINHRSPGHSVGLAEPPSLAVPSYARKIVLLLVLAILGQAALVTASADAKAARWHLRNTNNTGVANLVFDYGCWACTQTPVTGDWDNNGSDTPGMFDTAGGSPANWYLRNSNSGGPHDIFREYGLATGKPVVGKFMGVAAVDQTNVYVGGAWYLRRADGTTQMEYFGSSANQPLLGNSIMWGSWGSWADEPVIFNPSSGKWSWRYDEAGGAPPWDFYFGSPGDIALVGDWNGDGEDSPGVYHPSTSQFFLGADIGIHGPVGGTVPAQYSFTYGPANSGWKPITGDWNNDGVDTIGLVSPTP